jgi:pseudouridine-5'-phosphate glycosidase
MDILIAPEVEQALMEMRPVVALESTIISHGLPYPDNISAARQIEQAVRENGSVPATIAILNGKILVGLNDAQLDVLASSKEVMKVSRNDLPIAVVRKLHAATTVATTMLIAEKAGIHFFATGGIGGVHRMGYKTFDISADLTEMSRTSVCVVSAGAKAILDLPSTLEYLETMGVPVIGYGTLEFPAFYSRTSGLKLSLSSDDPGEIARFCKSKWTMGLDGGVLIANPIPEESEVPSSTMNHWIEEALEAAEREGIRGKEITPFLLARINAKSHGTSILANISLVLNNARLASQTAVAYSRIPV